MTRTVFEARVLQSDTLSLWILCLYSFCQSSSNAVSSPVYLNQALLQTSLQVQQDEYIKYEKGIKIPFSNLIYFFQYHS